MSTAEPREWDIHMQITKNIQVTVFADSEEEARKKADDLDWDGESEGELIDWQITSLQEAS